MIQIEPVANRRQLRAFLDLPARIHADDPAWVPPLRIEERRSIERRRNSAAAYCDFGGWLAWRDGAPVGRVIGILNRRYAERRGEIVARFGMLEALEERDVVEALLDAVESWGRRHGAVAVEGPRGFTDQDPEGLRVEGFEHPTTLACYQNGPALPAYVEQAGYAKSADYVVYRLPIPERRHPFYEQILRRVHRQGRYQLLEFKGRSSLLRYSVPILETMNESFAELEGYTRLDSGEIRSLAHRWFPFIDPRFVKVVLHGDQVAGFLLAVPNQNEGFRRTRGRLLPGGWLHLLRTSPGPQLDVLLGGVRAEHQGRGVDVLMADALLRAARDHGFEWLDSHHELESNFRARHEMERVDGKVWKRYRVYEKRL